MVLSKYEALSPVDTDPPVYWVMTISKFSWSKRKILKDRGSNRINKGSAAVDPKVLQVLFTLPQQSLFLVNPTLVIL